MPMPEKFIFKPEATIEKKEKAKIIVEKFIKELLSNAVLLGSGTAAHVKKFEDPDLGPQKICIKQIKKEIPKSDLIFLNSVETEMDIQDNAYKAGIRVPEPWFVYESADGQKFFVMETIEGYTIEDVLNERVERPEEILDYKSEFWEKLKDLINKLHDNNIYHRDISANNVMVGKDGEPVIIDFGRSATPLLSEDPYLKKNFPLPGEVFKFADDFDRFRTLRRSVAEALQNK